MSSSSALMIACFLAIAHANQLFHRPEYAANIHNYEDLVAYLATIENGQSFASFAGDKGVGTFGGSEDHTAILTCQPRHLRQYSYCPVRFEQTIPLPTAYTFAIAASGVSAEKTGPEMDPYNRASLLARAAVDQWNAATGRSDPHLAAAIQSDPAAPDRLRAILRDTPDLLRRFEQFHAESNEIIPAAADALLRNDIPSLSPLVDRSQHLAQTLLSNQTPETIHLARSARRLGSPAASAFGAGFGGSVWALIQTQSAPHFLAAWQADYHATFPTRRDASTFFLTRPGPAAARLFA
ncbi:MAG: galactokinase [Planctomycetota bacterium]|nr:galactokinase [Planctomycetota bacterium]